MLCPYIGEPCYEPRDCKDCWNYHGDGSHDTDCENRRNNREEGPHDPD